jgi:hypothetical protein
LAVEAVVVDTCAVLRARRPARLGTVRRVADDATDAVISQPVLILVEALGWNDT